jgi:hypothetical protein
MKPKDDLRDLDVGNLAGIVDALDAYVTQMEEEML